MPVAFSCRLPFESYTIETWSKHCDMEEIDKRDVEEISLLHVHDAKLFLCKAKEDAMQNTIMLSTFASCGIVV